MDDFVQESLIKQALKPLVGEAAAHRSFRFQRAHGPGCDSPCSNQDLFLPDVS